MDMGVVDFCGSWDEEGGASFEGEGWTTSSGFGWMNFGVFPFVSFHSQACPRTALIVINHHAQQMFFHMTLKKASNI